MIICALQSNPRNWTLSKKRKVCQCLNRWTFVHYLPHNNSLYVPVLRKQDIVHTFIFCLIKASACIRRFLLPILKTSKWPLYFRFSGNNFVSICCLSHKHCMAQPLILREGITLMLVKFCGMCKLYNASLCSFSYPSHCFLSHTFNIPLSPPFLPRPLSILQFLNVALCWSRGCDQVHCAGLSVGQIVCYLIMLFIQGWTVYRP